VTPDERQRLTEAFQRDDEDDAALADTLYLWKLRAYSDTLAELADGYDFEVEDITLSESIREALRAEAELRAQQINATFNGEVTSFIADIVDEASYEDAIESISAWSEARDADRSTLIGITEVYTAHADATLSFFRDAGIEADFDFGGHGDDHAECVVCQALERGNPHPYERVVEIGTPHIQCRQRWHPLIDPDELPDELALGQGDPAGIVGNDSLVHRAGGQQAAVEQLEA
jgi:hypothetical protein